MLTKNSSQTIEKVLEGIKDFDEIIILDTGSDDNTLDIVKNYKKAKVFFEKFNGYGHLRNLGAKYAKNDWILAIDSDEIININLKDEILKTKLNPSFLYGFYFHNHYNQKLIKCCGWYPEKHLRLYNKNKTKFSEDLVHEKLLDKGFKVNYFKTPIKHFPYRKIDDFLQKMSRYTTLFAIQNKDKKKSSLLKAVFHGFFAFLKSYILKKGFLAKKEGLIISVYNAHTAFYKYLKLSEINLKK